MSGIVTLGSADEASFGNPASLAGEGETAALHYHRLFGLVPVMAAQYTRTMASGTFGLGLMTQGDDLYRENTVSLAWARRFRVHGLRFDAGAAALVYTGAFGRESDPGSISGSVLGQGLHAGCRLRCTRTLFAGVTVRNLLNTLRWSTSGLGDYEEGVPRQLFLGLGLETQNLCAGFDWEPGLHREVPDRFHMGAEKTFFSMLILHAGTQWTGTGQETAWSAGLSLTHGIPGGRSLTFDAAYSIETLPNTLRFTLRFE